MFDKVHLLAYGIFVEHLCECFGVGFYFFAAFWVSLGAELHAQAGGRIDVAPMSLSSVLPLLQMSLLMTCAIERSSNNGAGDEEVHDMSLVKGSTT